MSRKQEILTVFRRPRSAELTFKNWIKTSASDLQERAWSASGRPRQRQSPPCSPPLAHTCRVPPSLGHAVPLSTQGPSRLFPGHSLLSLLAGHLLVTCQVQLDNGLAWSPQWLFSFLSFLSIFFLYPCELWLSACLSCFTRIPRKLGLS